MVEMVEPIRPMSIALLGHLLPARAMYMKTDLPTGKLQLCVRLGHKPPFERGDIPSSFQVITRYSLDETRRGSNVFQGAALRHMFRLKGSYKLVFDLPWPDDALSGDPSHPIYDA